MYTVTHMHHGKHAVDEHTCNPDPASNALCTWKASMLIIQFIMHENTNRCKTKNIHV